MELAEAANTAWSALAETLELQAASNLSPDRVRAALESDATGPKVRREVEAALMNTDFERSWRAGWLTGFPPATKSWGAGPSP
jgi:hypothetical protein